MGLFVLNSTYVVIYICTYVHVSLLFLVYIYFGRTFIPAGTFTITTKSDSNYYQRNYFKIFFKNDVQESKLFDRKKKTTINLEFKNIFFKFRNLSWNFNNILFIRSQTGEYTVEIFINNNLN